MKDAEAGENLVGRRRDAEGSSELWKEGTGSEGKGAESRGC